jgi:hypothetical protein
MVASNVLPPAFFIWSSGYLVIWSFWSPADVANDQMTK